MNTNKWLILVIVILALQVASSFRLVLSTTAMATQIGRAIGYMEPPGSTRFQEIPVDTTRPYWGSPNGPVQMVIFSDFQCPACALLAGQIPALKKRFGDSLFVTYRHFPLSSHSRSKLLAELSEVARRHGVFWAFKDSLFAHQADLDEIGLNRICRDIGFPATVSESDKRAAAADFTLADKLEVTSTPTIFINGRKVIGAYPLSVLAQIIGEELQSPQQRPMVCEE